jgi:hypothetical protein
MNFSAFSAFMKYDVAFFRIRLDGNRLHFPSTFIGSISRQNIYMKGPEAKRTVISRGFDQRRNFFFAMRTDKSAVVFDKSFGLYPDHLFV